MTDTVSAMRYYEDPAPADTPTSEDAFATKGKDAIAAVKANFPKWAQPGLSKAGDSDGGAVKDFAPWFSELQDLLAASAAWSDDHEAAHRLLYRYAVWKVGTDWKMSPIPPNVEFLFRFLGKSTLNQPEIVRLNRLTTKNGGVLFTETSTFFGTPGAPAWCGPAGSGAIQNVVAKYGMRLLDDGDPQGMWGRKAKSYVQGKDLDTVEMKPGDYIRVVGFRSPLSGHIATCVKAVPPSGTEQKIWYVSGNAGLFGGGSVRVDSVQREKPAEGYSYDKVTLLTGHRDTMNKEMKSYQDDLAAQQNASFYDGNQYDSAEEASRKQNAFLAQRQEAIQKDQAEIAKRQANVDRDNQGLIGMAQKGHPDDNPQKVDVAEKLLRPQSSGTVWLTFVSTTSQMNLTALKPASDPSMGDWMKRWDVGLQVVTQRKKS